MAGRIWIVLLGAIIVCRWAAAQGAGDAMGPAFVQPEVARLPSVCSPSPPAALPEGERGIIAEWPINEQPQVRRLPPVAAEVGAVEEVPLPPMEVTAPPLPLQWPVGGGSMELPAASVPAGRLWEGNFELGLAGAEGNNENMNFRFACGAKRRAPQNVLSADLSYRKQTQKTISKANRLYLDWRDEQLFPASRWTCFVHGTTEYDEFQSYNARVTSDLGVGYRLIRNEITTLSTRCGGGFSHKFGGPDERYVPEAVFGLDFESRLGKRQKLTISSEYTPNITAFAEYWVKSQAAWELLLDREMNLSLKFSAIDRYQSMPNGVRPNDVDYAATILWKF